MSPARAAAVAAFAVRTNARSGLTRAGVAGGLAILLLGPAVGLATGAGAALDPELAFYGFLVALLFGVRSGLQDHRAGDLDLFLTHNLVRPSDYALGMVASLLAGWLLLCAGLFATLLLVTGGDAATAAWHTAAWGLRSGILVGFVPVVESVSSLRVPFVIPALGYLFTLVGLSAALGEERAMALLAVVERSRPETLRPLAAQAASLLVLTCGGFILLAGLRGAAGLRRAREGAEEIVPTRHGGAPPPM